MAINLSRRLSSLIDIARPKLALSASFPDIATRSVPNSVSRLVSSSAPHLQQNKDQLHQSSSDIKNPSEAPDKEIAASEENDGSDDEVGGEHVNEETGEIGGPRGPEPTRYGDWEKGGRCSDF